MFVSSYRRTTHASQYCPHSLFCLHYLCAFPILQVWGLRHGWDVLGPHWESTLCPVNPRAGSAHPLTILQMSVSFQQCPFREWPCPTTFDSLWGAAHVRLPIPFFLFHSRRLEPDMQFRLTRYGSSYSLLHLFTRSGLCCLWDCVRFYTQPLFPGYMLKLPTLSMLPNWDA